MGTTNCCHFLTDTPLVPNPAVSSSILGGENREILVKGKLHSKINPIQMSVGKPSKTKVLKDFTDQKQDEKNYKKVPIFRCTTPSTGKRLGEVVVGTLCSIMYQRRLLLTSSLLMVLYTEISELFCTSFRLAFGR